jgi:hypothetical protein
VARTSQQFSQSEYEAYEKYATENGLVLNGANGRKNGDLLGGFILKMNQEITAATLDAAVQQLRSQLAWKSVAEREFDHIAGELNESEKSTVTSWLERQKQLVTDGDPGLENFSIIVGWLRARNYPISEQNLNTSLRNVVNNGQKALRWKPAPAADRTIVGGKINHALTEAPATPTTTTEPENAWVGGRKNHARNPQFAPTPTPAASNWQAKAESVRGNRHSENLALRRMFKMDSTGAIDWKATYEARDRAASGTRGSI